jgi:hypothetical protein
MAQIEQVAPASSSTSNTNTTTPTPPAAAPAQEVVFQALWDESK